MSNTLQHIAELTEQRRQLHEEGLRRWLSDKERVRLKKLDTDITAAWETRRQELAQARRTPHELIIVRELKAREVGR